MPFTVSYWLFVFVSFILKGLSTGQQFWNQEFVFAIPTVESHNTPRILISTTIDTPVDVQVLVTGIDFVTNTNVTRSKHTEIILPTSAQLSGHGLQNRTIIVRSSVFISVHGRNDDYSNPDGFLALPNSQQGLEYYIASYTPWTYGQSQFSVSSQAKETRVHIETAQGAIEDIVLQPYESYQYLSGTDLTGTRVEADNPVTVMAGVDKAIIPVDITGWDSILEQLPPINLWGVQFVVGPFAGVPAEYRFRIIAGNETVQVTVSGSSIRILKRNFYEGSGSGVTTITSDKPVLVVQYMPNGSPGAACMVLVSPKQLYVGNMMIFPVYPATFRYITLIVHCDMLEGFILNEDELIKNWDMLSTTDGTMCALSKQVEEGTYRVRNSNKEVRFTGYVYGYNFAYAYAYPAGVGYIPDVALHFDSATVSVSEGDETLTLVVTNEGGESTMITLATIDIETTENFDYTSKDGQVLEIGGYATVTFDIDITDDNSAEWPERFDVTFMEGGTDKLITCRVTILDDDYVTTDSTSEHQTLPTEVSSTSIHQTLPTEGFSTGLQFWNQEFVFAIPTATDGLSNNTPRILISTTVDTPVDVQVLVTGIDFVADIKVTRSQHAEIILPTSAQLSGHGLQNRTIIVRSSVFISVHGMNDDYYNPDGFLALPNNQQGLEYYIASYTPLSYSHSQFSISSQAKETRVHIETAQGATEDVVLQPYESYQYLSGTDLTGTRIEADNPITVMAGVDQAIIPIGMTGWDSILEQLPPTNLWGVQFVVGPFAGVPVQYRFRIIAGNETVQVTVAGISIQILIRNFYEGSGSGVTTITSDKPVLVVQYMPNGSPGAPCMVLVSPKQLYVGNMMIFPVYPAAFRYITLIVHCDMLEGFILNEDELIKNWDMLTTTDETMCALSKQVEEGTYIVRHSNTEVRFTGYVYGYSFGSGYAYPAAVGFIPDVTTTDSTSKHQTFPTEISSTSNHHTLQTEGCLPFAIPDDGTVQPIEDSYKFGQTVTVYCRSGFNLIGDETLVCLESGVWHGELPKCSPQSTNGRRISNTVLISAATTGCAVFVFIVVVVIVCFFCKRKRKSDDKTPYYTTHIEMSPKERQETSPGSIDGVYSNPLDNNGYQDLQMPPPATNYHELYTEVPDRVYVQS